MAQPGGPTAKAFLFIAIAFALKWASKRIERLGDAAPVVPGGVSVERLQYHLTALLLMLGAIGFFVAALVSLYRGWRK